MSECTSPLPCPSSTLAKWMHAKTKAKNPSRAYRPLIRSYLAETKGLPSGEGLFGAPLASHG